MRQSVQHTDTGSENNPGSDVYSEVDLESHSSQSAVYTRPAKCDDTAKVTENTVQYSVSNNYIKVKYIVTEVFFITLTLILLSHISSLQVVRHQTEDNILKTDLRTE